MPYGVGGFGISNAGGFSDLAEPETSAGYDSVLPTNYTVSGVTRDVNGDPLGGCLVLAFDTLTNVCITGGYSDAAGNYSLGVTYGRNFYLVSYLPGSPDVAGTTVNTLQGV